MKKYYVVNDKDSRYSGKKGIFVRNVCEDMIMLKMEEDKCSIIFKKDEIKIIKGNKGENKNG